MYNKYSKNRVILKFFTLISILVLVLSGALAKNVSVKAMPFYDLQPRSLVLRSKFYTSYSSSSPERKSNIKIASLALDKTFIDVNGEFSFNQVVGERSEKRGYKKSKIIVDGEFVDGIGGGVCQVSTTLYNAILLSGLKITEYHPHSLPVSYVSPSFDAMVSFGFADLKFINDTRNPIIIHAVATDNSLTVEVYGEPSEYTYIRQSVIVEEIPAPKEQEVLDENKEYPELYLGQKKVIKYSKHGLKTQGYIIKTKNGQLISSKILRSDTYKATRGLIVCGTTPIPITSPQEDMKIQENNALGEFIRNI